MRVTLTRAQPLRGRVAVPPDKSISHRALILGALSSGLHIENLSPSDDVKATLRCVEALGAEITREEDGSIVVRAGRPRAESASSRPAICRSWCHSANRSSANSTISRDTESRYRWPSLLSA